MDSRFDTSAWEKEDLAEQQESAGSEEVSDASNEDADAGPSRSPLLSADENDTLDDVATSGEAKVVKPLSKEELSEYEKKHKKRGIVYISRIPPGMTPAKVRHLLSRFGDIERVYLQADGGEFGVFLCMTSMRKSNRDAACISSLSNSKDLGVG